jgi:hypothetical protein
VGRPECMRLSFTIVVGRRQHSHSRVRVQPDSRPCFTLSDTKLMQTGEAGPYIYVPQWQGGPVLLPRLGSLFVAHYDSQDYSGGIPSYLHAGIKVFNFRLFCHLSDCRTFGVASLTRGRVCNLVVKLAITLGFKSRRTHDHNLI